MGIAEDGVLSLARLKQACAEPNPVNIAGYGRESTHKGYLSWILSGERWKGAEEACLALRRTAASKDSPESVPGEAKDVETTCEHTLGQNHKVDLVTRFRAGGVKYAMPIELKTDSQPKHDQFEALSKGTITDGQIPVRIALLLGASSVMTFPDGENTFIPLGPAHVLRELEPMKRQDCQFFSDWLSALREEIARHSLALTAYQSGQICEFENLRQWGYRSKTHLMFYVCDQVRRCLPQVIEDSRWEIYSGGYNAVMNLRVGPDPGWIPLRLWPQVQAYFEFNDDRFVLKIQKPSAKHMSGEGRPEDHEKLKHALQQWMKEVRNRVSSANSGLPEIGTPRNNKMDKEWLSVIFWKFDLSDPEIVARQVREIWQRFGREGLLREYT